MLEQHTANQRKFEQLYGSLEPDVKRRKKIYLICIIKDLKKAIETYEPKPKAKLNIQPEEKINPGANSTENS